MSEHFNKLTPAEAERLAILAEECAEVIQVVGKILRHGYESYDPTTEGAPRNRELLVKELSDVEAAMHLIRDDARPTNTLRANKLLNIKQWLHHQET